MGAPLRAARAGPVVRRSAALLPRRPRARPAHAAAPRCRPRRRRGGGAGHAAEPRSGAGRSRVLRRCRPGRARRGASSGFDEPEAQAVIDRVLAAATSDALLVDVLLPFLRDLGDRWRRGETSIGEEHFASSVIRGRMLGLARGWGRGLGPVALLACLPGEQHELGLIAFGLALRARGWRIAYLGSDTPLEEIETRERERPGPDRPLRGLAQSASSPSRRQIRTLAKRRRVALGGAGAREEDAKTLGVLALTGDPVSEAERITSEWPAGLIPAPDRRRDARHRPRPASSRSSASTAARRRMRPGRGARRSNGSSRVSRRASRHRLRGGSVSREVVEAARAGARRTRGPRSPPSGRCGRCSSASRWAALSRCGAPTRRASTACSASRRGSPTGSTSRGCAAGGSTCCTDSSTGGFPGSPASAPTSSRRGFERARGLGVEGSYRIIPGAVHGIAVRARRRRRAAAARPPLGRARRGADRDLGGGVSAQVGTVRAAHEPDQPGGDARRRRRPAARHRRRRGSALGSRLPLGRRRRARRLLRRLRVRDDDRLPPLLHAQGLRGAHAREGDARDPRLHDDAGPAHPVGHRPSQAPRALGPAGRPALAARRPRRRRVGRGRRASCTRTSAGCSRTSAWRRGASTAATSTTTASSSGSTGCTCSGSR